MNLSDFTPQSLLLKVVAWIGVVGLVAGVLVATANHFENVGYQKRVGEDQVNLNKELIEAKDQTQSLQHQLNEAQNALAKSKAALSILNANNRNSIGKLRDSFNSFNGGMSNESREALARRISSLSTVVADCSARLVEVANDADTAIAETQMFEKAWPK